MNGLEKNEGPIQQLEHRHKKRYFIIGGLLVILLVLMVLGIVLYFIQPQDADIQRVPTTKQSQEEQVQTSEQVLWKQNAAGISLVDEPSSVALAGNFLYIAGAHLEKRNPTTGELIWSQNIEGELFSITTDNTALYGAGGVANWHVEKRSLDDGSIIWRRPFVQQGGFPVPHDTALDMTGLYVVGQQGIPGRCCTQWRIEKRNLQDGTLIWERESLPSLESSIAWGVAVAGDVLYVVGYDQIAGGKAGKEKQWRIEKRKTTDGDLIWRKTFNQGDENRIVHVAPNGDEARDVVLDDEGNYIYVVGVAYDDADGRGQWRIEKRNTETGDIAWVQTSNPSSLGTDEAVNVILNGNILYVAGTKEWRVEKRSTEDGRLLGTQISRASGDGWLEINQIVMDEHSIYVVGVEVGGITEVNVPIFPRGDTEKIGTQTNWRIERREK